MAMNYSKRSIQRAHRTLHRRPILPNVRWRPRVEPHYDLSRFIRRLDAEARQLRDDIVELRRAMWRMFGVAADTASYRSAPHRLRRRPGMASPTPYPGTATLWRDVVSA